MRIPRDPMLRFRSGRSLRRGSLAPLFESHVHYEEARLARRVLTGLLAAAGVTLGALSLSPRAWAHWHWTVLEAIGVLLAGVVAAALDEWIQYRRRERMIEKIEQQDDRPPGGGSE